ncbi:Endonuclease/exonuclease/phosphatase [Macrophomina phaseolina MS6]|uniref:Endonuclease/exonuclease/phosphatase n=1 Tax=Macrophomina phaseolina (strain MS6) TaxID=1126212 RepID=K2R508_MACPH|nr:Endonuclease/exonuclease/phosphatase [Macrophomina phaseolina MS6]
MAPLFRDRRTREFDIIAVQEPWKNPVRDTTHHPLRMEFELLYPNGPARTCIFVNKRIAPSSWAVTYHASDLCTLHLRAADNSNARGAIHIHNVYSPPRATGATSSLHELAAALREHPNDQHIVLGDLNLHHPLWTGPEYGHQDPEADELIHLLERFSLHLASPQAIPTFARNDAQTTIDLVFVTAGIIEHLVKCQVREDLQQDSDHIPVTTVVDLSPPRCPPEARPNWRSSDIAKLKRTFEEILPRITPLHSVEILENFTDSLVQTIKQAIDISTPPLQVSPRSIPGWTKECKEAQMETRRMCRVLQRTRSEEDWERYRSMRNRKGRLIQKALQQEHRTKIEAAATKENGIWRLAKWAQYRETDQSSHMPALRKPDLTYAEQPKEKLDTLREAFFPKHPQADLSDIEGFVYPQEVPWPDITEEEVRLAVQRAKPWKAPGPDGIPNGILQQLGPTMIPALTSLYNASLRLGHCPSHFRQSTTLALRKHNKDDYTDPKSYRPIALTNTIGKILESIIARRMSYLAERLHLLPQSHIGGRRDRSTEHAVHLLVETVHSAWNSADPRVATLLKPSH